MIYAYLQDVPIRECIYRRVISELGPEPLAGQLAHLCVKQPDGALRYIDIWESEEACAKAFEDRIHPAVGTAFGATRPDTEPSVHRLDVLHACVISHEDTWA